MTNAERRELRDDLKSEIEEVACDLADWVVELADLKDRIAQGRKTRLELIGRRNALKTVKV